MVVIKFQSLFGALAADGALPRLFGEQLGVLLGRKAVGLLQPAGVGDLSLTYLAPRIEAVPRGSLSREEASILDLPTARATLRRVSHPLFRGRGRGRSAH